MCALVDLVITGLGVLAIGTLVLMVVGLAWGSVVDFVVDEGLGSALGWIIVLVALGLLGGLLR